MKNQLQQLTIRDWVMIGLLVVAVALWALDVSKLPEIILGITTLWKWYAETQVKKEVKEVIKNNERLIAMNDQLRRR